ncbi:helix-turn-helix domain-containing protein [Halorubrum laminariae]|uniref:Helix-turn-helix domain-containing protein n=1 Tax=Halorubrum laminariae TaxID=1433523 RepID=A0ABD6C4K7_9EURY|nr:helix-turn-helix domain-containing protein [Halorubrum laminariae]
MNDNIKTKSVEKTFAIVEELREREGNGAGVSELTDAVDIPKSTVHRHLSTLNELGYVTLLHVQN